MPTADAHCGNRRVGAVISQRDMKVLVVVAMTVELLLVKAIAGTHQTTVDDTPGKKYPREGIEGKMSDWKLDMLAEPVVPPWKVSADCDTNGSELQRAIVRGFSSQDDPIWSHDHKESSFEMTFTFKEHGEFFRGALTLASLRYANDFYELLKRYGTIKVTLNKKMKPKEQPNER